MVNTSVRLWGDDVTRPKGVSVSYPLAFGLIRRIRRRRHLTTERICDGRNHHQQGNREGIALKTPCLVRLIRNCNWQGDK